MVSDVSGSKRRNSMLNIDMFPGGIEIIRSIIALIYSVILQKPHRMRGRMINFPLAIIADIHGNRWALEAVLRDIERRHIQQIVNLGDCVLGPLDPAGTANRLMELDILTVQGNDDRVLLSPPEHPSASVTYTLKYLEQVPYNWEKAARVAYDNGRADWAAWIATGRL